MENNNRFVPGQALSFADIQKRFNGQQVYLTPDGYISILMKNGLGLQINMVEEFEKYLDFSVKIGRMNKQGGIFGKYQNSIISLNRKIADNFTLNHEIFHFLREMGVITPVDVQLLGSEFDALKRAGKLTSPVDDNEEENLASTFAQILNDREKYRGSLIGRIIQKATDFVDGMFHIGQMTIRKMAREIESGRIFSREPDIQGQYVSVPQYEKTTAEWYSQMRNVLEQKLTTGPAEMVKAQIQAWARKGEFKKEELEWSGLLEWLDSQKKVTRQDVLDYLDLNQVKVEAVERDRRYPEEVWDMSESEYEEYKRYNPELFQDTTKFSEYQEPGGSNYKELLLTLPKNMSNEANEQFRVFSDQLKEKYGMSSLEALEKNLLTTEEKRKYNRLDEEANAKQEQIYSDVFTSSHYPNTPNILVHVRMNERVDLNGERVLFLEEVQSDLHQLARKKGYRSEKNIKEYEKRNKEGVAALSDIGLNPSPYDLGWVFSKGGETDTRSMKARADRQAALKETFGGKWVEETKALMDKSLVSDIPNAPFKKTWPLLAIKKIVRYAAENGFAKIAWTTGETQAARYDLSKQVETLYVFKQKSGGYLLNAIGYNGEKHIGKVVPESEIENYIGKELAGKIISGKNIDLGYIPPPGEKHISRQTFREKDLKVGGEGLKAFYDRILPAEVNKFFNKKVWGGAKVEQAVFDGEKKYEIGQDKDGKWVVIEKPGGILHSGLLNKNIAEQLATAYREDNGLNAWALPITPQMRQKALREGMPMFMAVNKGYLGNNTSAYELIRSSKKMDQEAKKSAGEGDIPPYWRIQGSSIRHSGIGERLSQKDADAIMGLLRAHDFFGKYNPRTGTIQDVHREGSLRESQDLLSRLWQDHGSESIQIAKREAAEERQNMKEAAKDAAIASDLDRLSSEVVWIDQNLGEAEMNDYNKCTLAKYLAGEVEHLPMINWKWADPLQKLGAVKGKGMEQQADFESLKTAYMQACTMAEVDEEDYGPRM